MTIIKSKMRKAESEKKKEIHADKLLRVHLARWNGHTSLFLYFPENNGPEKAPLFIVHSGRGIRGTPRASLGIIV